ncbi:metallo-mystery pair system four-Cys motif protein [Lujinxingia sediminis]|uniref:Metallo-mystery pair system four-Cys motif protein n=1 Tax=Lujinxingia sediminis TaxID=2480984 RepID=A0ABY0CRI9_9DELT|nr:MbnP family copper-binding protein [Lujinxingia sediminis]RVU43123.1 metallo-mystery pair system four-Cys motif protein [Lujinxingia sediminis]
MPLNTSPLTRTLLLPTLLLLIAGCGSAEDDATTQPLTLNFAAQVGQEAFACGQTYEGLGSTQTTFEPFDFRVFISEIELRDDGGQWQPLNLDQDGIWQHQNLALLDFEDATGRCQNGSAETRDIVTGTLPEGTYDALRFTIGVPFELNHIDAATAPSPLNTTAMFWSWLGGYKFMRIEGATTGLDTGWQFHLGSTGCEPAEGGGATSCANPNRARVELSDVDFDADTLIFDLAELVAGANLDQHQESTPSGCMSGPTDSDCQPIFSALNLPHSEQSPEPRQVVRIQAR